MLCQRRAVARWLLMAVIAAAMVAAMVIADRGRCRVELRPALVAAKHPAPPRLRAARVRIGRPERLVIVDDDRAARQRR